MQQVTFKDFFKQFLFQRHRGTATFMNGFIDAANTERNTQPIVKELADSGAG
jgi:hypothetical protein